MNRYRNLFLSTCFACLGALIVGCADESISEIEDLQMVLVLSRGDELSRTMEYVRSLERYESIEFQNKVNSGLNRWLQNLDDRTVLESWKQPELMSTLPQPLDDTTVLPMLLDESFSGNDANFVQQAFWLKALADRIEDENFIWNFQYPFQLAVKSLAEDQKQEFAEKEDLLTETIRVLHPELSQPSDDRSTPAPVKQLATAMKMFDWTVRNVQLLELPQWPIGQAVVDGALNNQATPSSWPPAVGTPGPGYRRYPWQTLTHGKGEMLDRAEIFVMLCHQMDLPAVILALPMPAGSEDGQSLQPYREWLPAAIIAGQLYLFDTQLGIPIPGEKPGTVATLAQVVEKPQLLRGLDLTIDESIDELNYRIDQQMIDQGMLEKLIALVVAPPESLSKRMAAMQSKLTGEARLKIVVEAQSIADQLSDNPNVNEVRLWHAPFSTQLYRNQVSEAVVTAQFDQEIQRKLAWYPTEEAYIDQFVAFRAAKNLYLRGVFETDRTVARRNCISQFFDFMYSDEDIAQLERDRVLQQHLGIYRATNQPFEEWNRNLMVKKSLMKLIRADAAFFLALCHYENGYPSTAIKWLERTPIYDDQGRWTPYGDYQMARAYEAINQFDRASDFYESDESPQRHGSLIRKRWARQMQSQ